MTGTVLKTWYRRWEEEDDENDDDDDDNDDDDYDDDDYEGGCDVVPYFVQLDNGDLVSAPQDDDSCIKGSTVPPIPLRFREGEELNI